MDHLPKRIPIVLSLFFLCLAGFAQQDTVRVEPPFWWTGFRQGTLQLMVHSRDIASASVSVRYPGVELTNVHRTGNPNYLFLDLTIDDRARPGVVLIRFAPPGKKPVEYRYELKARRSGSADRKGFSPSDVIYLLMPDRFANGDTTNDSPPGMAEAADRKNKDGRHGGDLKGILNHLDYLSDLGVTAVWLNPVLENDQPVYSYHGYATTDYYKVDPRLGSNEDYLKLSEELHRKGIKLIKDMIFNHCGSRHWWMEDLPSPDWINTWPDFNRTSYRASTATDPHVSRHDSLLFLRGWFDRSMPDLNQDNPFLRNYLIQNSIWWIEHAGLDGIRHDTHPYPFRTMTSEWGARIRLEYPGFMIVGECWLNYPASVAYWQSGSNNRDGYDSHIASVFDFPLYDALSRAFSEPEGWNTGIARLYEILAQDFSYPAPENLVTFADNHDVNRYLDSQGDDIRKLKMAVAFLLTTRGIPQIYYGTEVLLSTGPDKSGDGNKRRDFPGGWPSDEKNAFTATGLSASEIDMLDFTRNLVRWRKGCEAVRTGRLTHFVPSEGVYVYFRHTSRSAVMVIMNNAEETRKITADRYKEILGNYREGNDVISGTRMTDLSGFEIGPKRVMVIELK